MIKDADDAFLVPIPQYPLYSAALTLYGGTLIPYYLDEAQNWGIDVAGVEQLIADARTRGMRVRGMVVINPGNPTGQVLSLENQARSRPCRVTRRGALHVLHAWHAVRRQEERGVAAVPLWPTPRALLDTCPACRNTASLS